jgi:3-deoxy-7-phosphoheptulonate synthase
VDVTNDISAQISKGSHQIFGVMVESHLEGGAQKFTPGKDDPSALKYAQSITDACIGWPDSEKVLETLSKAVLARRQK